MEIRKLFIYCPQPIDYPEFPISSPLAEDISPEKRGQLCLMLAIGLHKPFKILPLIARLVRYGQTFAKSRTSLRSDSELLRRGLCPLLALSWWQVWLRLETGAGHGQGGQFA
jgi:hypothetical protein